MFVKGQVANPNGRPKGSVNPATKRFKKALNIMLEDLSGGAIQEWLSRVAEDDPKGALAVVTNLAEYIHPKLQRTEVTGKDGEQLTINNILTAIETPTLPSQFDLPAIEGEVIDDTEYKALMTHGILESPKSGSE